LLWDSLPPSAAVSSLFRAKGVTIEESFDVEVEGAEALEGGR